MKQGLQPSKSGRVNERPQEDLKQALRLVMLKVGLRAANLPNDEERQVLIDHALKYYGNHTPEEIKYAFDLAITDKLDLEAKDVTCYENFSCLYFSTIMNAYRKWINNEFKQGRIETVNQKLIEYQPDRDQIEKEYQQFLASGEAKRFLPKDTQRQI